MHSQPEPRRPLPIRTTHIEPDRSTGTSAAVVVNAAAGLAHTTQLLPLDSEGRLVGAGSAEAQVDQLLANLRRALAPADAGLSDLVKLNVYLREEAVADGVRRRLAHAFSEDVRPAVSYVVTALPHAQALVALDAVAVTPHHAEAVTYHHAPALAASHGTGSAHVSVLPPGGKVYLSGQTAPGLLPEATRGTMESLHRTLAHLGLEPADVFQVKAFLHPMADAAQAADVIRTFYPAGAVPPLVFVEWFDASYLDYLSLDPADGPLPIEIELHAVRRAPDEQGAQGETGPAVTYSTPPGLSAPATYSRVAEVHRGDLVFVSGLYGDPALDAEGQTRDLFARLSRLLDKSGSSFDHLAKGTYYVTDRASSEALNEVRTSYYDPRRAPTSSKMPVRGVGLRGARLTFDMIGVVAP